MKLKYFYFGLALLAVIACALAIIALYHSPVAEVKFIRENDKWYISEMAEDKEKFAAAIKEHKQVVAINDWKLGKYDLQKEFDDINNPEGFRHFMAAQKYFWENIKVDKPFSIKFSDSSSMQITPTKMSLLDVLYRVGLLFAASIITLIIGLSIFLQKPDDEKAKAFLLLTIGLSVTDTMVGFAAGRDISSSYPILALLNIMDSLSIFMCTAALLHFVLVFPRHQPFVNNTIIAVIYILAVIEAFLFGSKLFYPVYPGMVIVNMLISMAVIAYSYMTLKSPEEKAQVKWILFGIIFSLIVFILIYFLPMMITGKKSVSAVIPMLSSVILPLMMAFAISRYKLMDIDTLLDNTLIYVITLGLLGIGDLFLISLLTKLEILNISQPVAIIIGVWLIIFTYIPVRNTIQTWIKKLLKREVYDINRMSIQLSQKLLSINTIKEAYEIVDNYISDALHPKGSDAYILNENGRTNVIWETTKNLPLIVPLGQSEPIHLYQLANPKILPNNYSGGIYVPVVGSGNKQMGYTILQNKYSGRLYDNAEIELLKIMSGQLAMTIEALRAREGLKQKELETAKEKERLAREIHDGIGNNLAQAKVLMASNNDPATILKELYPLLDEGLKEIRDLIWVSDKEDIVITELVSYIEAKLSQLQNIVPISIQTNITDKGIRLSAAQKMVILRVVQEAVTNTIKHAHASKISISIEQDESKLKVSISDNGQGFDTTKENTGYGIKNIQKRCSEIGAKLEITSEVNKGTSISIEFTQTF